VFLNFSFLKTKIMNEKKITPLVIKSLGITALLIIIINLISLAFAYFNLNTQGNITMKFDNGMFWLNGEQSGMNFTEFKYWAFYFLIFASSFTYLKKQQS